VSTSQNAEADPVDLRDRLRAQPEVVLGEQFGRYRARLARIVQFRLDPLLAARIEPDDVLQESWLAAVKRVDSFLQDESMPMFVWLRLMVGQTIIDIHRHHLGTQMRDAYREQSLNRNQLSHSTAASIVSKLLGHISSPSRVAVRDETARQLREAVEGMDAIDREVLALRHFEELSNTEVASVLEIEPKAASIRYVRAIQRLKKILDGVPGFNDTANSFV
jgi:RNA polymerase sigma-70 factor (ECF subfamily)